MGTVHLRGCFYLCCCHVPSEMLQLVLDFHPFEHLSPKLSFQIQKQQSEETV